MLKLEHLFFDPTNERSGVSVIIWGDKTELARCLVVVRALLSDQLIEDVLVSSDKASVQQARELIERRRTEDSVNSPFLSLFVQQATTEIIGPLLNGSRKPLADPPGSLLVLRSADFHNFLRSAPDLASFVVHRMFDSAELMSAFESELASKFSSQLPQPLNEILESLPGDSVSQSELDEWVASCSRDGKVQ